MQVLSQKLLPDYCDRRTYQWPQLHPQGTYTHSQLTHANSWYELPEEFSEGIQKFTFTCIIMYLIEFIGLYCTSRLWRNGQWIGLKTSDTSELQRPQPSPAKQPEESWRWILWTSSSPWAPQDRFNTLKDIMCYWRARFLVRELCSVVSVKYQVPSSNLT